MSLALALNNALSGLNVNQRALATLSQNISNANTPGYSRQVVDLSSQYLDGVGAGVRVEDITRKVDIYLQRAINTQTSHSGGSNIIDEYMQRAQILYGEPGSANSMDEYVESFFNALDALSLTPELPSLRNNAVNSGVALARELSTLAMSLEDLRFQADKDINEAVNFLNGELEHLYTLNTAINRAHALGNSTAGLLDQRDQAIQSIADFVDVKVYFKENGEVNLFTANGISLLDDSRYRLMYSPIPAVETLINDGVANPLQITRVDGSGVPVGNPVDLISSGVEGNITTVLRQGKLKALKDLRDTTFPDMLAQLDMLAAVLRDEFNRIHNDGSGFPGAHDLTGTRAVVPSDRSDWSGEVMIGVVDSEGKPVAGRYADEEDGFRPLTLDLASLNSGSGNGQPSVQAIIDEINAHFGIPQNKAEVGNLNNIRLVSNSSSLPGPLSQFSFDFELENISASDADFFVTGVTVLDDTAANITSVTSTIPQVPLNGAATYVTTALSNIVTVNTAVPHGFVEGQRIYLSDPGGPVDGIPAAELNNFFTISNVTANSFDIAVSSLAVAGGPQAVAGVTASPKYDSVVAGEKSRTIDAGTLTADLTANLASAFYMITVSVAVDDHQGGLSTATLQFRINNNNVNLLNDRYSVTAVNGNGVLVGADTNQGVMRAMLVDENGVELPMVNGVYADQVGYLKLEALDPNYRISIDELDSRQLGLASANPTVPGSGRGFSHYFELNNFFKSNNPIAAGDTLTNSAINMAVEDRFTLDPNLISTGQLTRSNQPTNSTPRSIGLTDNPFSTTLGSQVVRITTGAAHGLNNGDTIDINYSGLAVNGIPANELNRSFTVTNVTETSFEIIVGVAATATGSGGGPDVTASTRPENLPVYTFERFIGDNKVVQRLADLSLAAIDFMSAGGLPTTKLTFNGYAGSILGFAASSAVDATNAQRDNEILLEGFQTRANAVSGVNLDEELANTIIYQNAYVASARVITVTDELFDALLNAV